MSGLLLWLLWQDFRVLPAVVCGYISLRYEITEIYKEQKEKNKYVRTFKMEHHQA